MTSTLPVPLGLLASLISYRGVLRLFIKIDLMVGDTAYQDRVRIVQAYNSQLLV